MYCLEVYVILMLLVFAVKKNFFCKPYSCNSLQHVSKVNLASVWYSSVLLYVMHAIYVYDCHLNLCLYTLYLMYYMNIGKDYILNL